MIFFQENDHPVWPVSGWPATGSQSWTDLTRLSSKTWRMKSPKKFKVQIAMKFSMRELECFCSVIRMAWHCLMSNKGKILGMWKFPSAGMSFGHRIWQPWLYCPSIASPFATRNWRLYVQSRRIPESNQVLGMIKEFLSTRHPIISSMPLPMAITELSGPWTCQCTWPKWREIIR